MIPLITDERRIIFLFCIPDLHDGRFILKLILYSGLKARRCSNTCWAWMFGMILSQKGYYPAFHMNKKCWVSIILEDALSDEEIRNRIRFSFETV